MSTINFRKFSVYIYLHLPTWYTHCVAIQWYRIHFAALDAVSLLYKIGNIPKDATQDLHNEIPWAIKNLTTFDINIVNIPKKTRMIIPRYWSKSISKMQSIGMRDIDDESEKENFGQILKSWHNGSTRDVNMYKAKISGDLLLTHVDVHHLMAINNDIAIHDSSSGVHVVLMSAFGLELLLTKPANLYYQLFKTYLSLY